MLNRTMFSVTLLLCLGLAIPLSSTAQVVNEEAGALPPPPGPYVSSRTKLKDAPSESSDSGMNLPFMGDMPMQGMPMRYMPSPNQMPAPPFGWRGPMTWR